MSFNHVAIAHICKVKSNTLVLLGVKTTKYTYLPFDCTLRKRLFRSYHNTNINLVLKIDSAST